MRKYTDSITWSRAGDAFHYRWAARRCLALLNPVSTLDRVIIEGSKVVKKTKKSGENVIDVSEYYEGNKIRYFQLKHTIKSDIKPFTIGLLKVTFEGFGNRFRLHKSNDTLDNVSFEIVTNRKIGFKDYIKQLIDGTTVNAQFLHCITEYTQLSGEDLSLFCSKLVLSDHELNFTEQKRVLKYELASYSTSQISDSVVDSIVALVQNSFTDGLDREITREVILTHIGAGSIVELFPAIPKWAPLETIIEREQYAKIISQVSSHSDQHIIIHAAGGVGKSVLTQKFRDAIKEPSITIAYDCFGAGDYRAHSSSRHCHSTALVEIVNELSAMGLCSPMINFGNLSIPDILKHFLSRIRYVISNLKKTHLDAQLFILVDAADNSIMAANEFGESCFITDLLKEKLPNGCKLIYLCRTERIDKITSSNEIINIELMPFSEAESKSHLLSHYPNANDADCAIFHKITSANPRIQANLLSKDQRSFYDSTNSFYSTNITLDDQIHEQLEQAKRRIKGNKTDIEGREIEMICLGLSTLPPNIPINVLAAVSDLDVSTIKSFIGDWGAALWVTDTIVHFRDEPTESWFRKHYNPALVPFDNYIHKLELLSSDYFYVAESLPSLYLQAKKYDKLIEVALTTDYLPVSNPVEYKHVYLYRLKFALRAALKKQDYKSVIHLAFKTSEATSGNNRRNKLYRENLDLLALLYDDYNKERLAYSRELKGDWIGSENIYSALLLSSIKRCRGEAELYFRSAMRYIFASQKAKNKNNKIEDYEFTYLSLIKYNLDGVKGAISFIDGFTNSDTKIKYARLFISTLIDRGDIDVIQGFIKSCKKNYIIALSAIDQLVNIGIYPSREDIECYVSILSAKHRKLPNNAVLPILSLVDSAMHYKFSKEKINTLLDYYVNNKFTSFYIDVSHDFSLVSIILRKEAARKLLNDDYQISIPQLLSEELTKSEDDKKMYNDFEFTILELLPWYIIRAQVVFDDTYSFSINKSKLETPNRYDRHFLDLALLNIKASILSLCDFSQERVDFFYNTYLNGSKYFYIEKQVDILKLAYRKDSSLEIIGHMEQNVNNVIIRDMDDILHDIDVIYAKLSRAVLSDSKEEAREYFRQSVDIVVKFGDEIPLRIDAISSLVDKFEGDAYLPDELAYKFIRCIEFSNIYTDSNINVKSAVSSLIKAAPQSTIAAISRWRDRDALYIDDLLQPMILGLLESRQISSETAWALSRFDERTPSLYFLEECVNYTSYFEVKQQLFDDFVNLTLANEGCNADWYKIYDITQRTNLNCNKVKKIISSVITPNKQSVDSFDCGLSNHNLDYESILNGKNLMTLEGIEDSIAECKSASKNKYCDLKHLYRCIIARLKYDDVWEFLNILHSIQAIGLYEITDCLQDIQSKYHKNKVSFKTKWHKAISIVAQKYANELSIRYYYESFISSLRLDEDEINMINNEILDGCSDYADDNSSISLLGLIHIAKSNISIEDVNEIVTHEITRFESLISNEVGDGIWSEQYKLRNHTVNSCIANFIWRGLGDPVSKIRWKSAHVIKTLGQFRSFNIISSIIECLDNDNKLFVSNKFEPYVLHSKLYLFIALARVSFKDSIVLLKHRNVFIKYLTHPHILIRKYVSTIILNIETNNIGTYDSTTLHLATTSTTSPFKPIKKSHTDTINSYWHENNIISSGHKFYFGWDINNYWFRKLGDVFGVTASQIEDLAADVIIEQLEYSCLGGYMEDPRHIRWDRNHVLTNHDHGSYPRADNLNFYLSYHSMMIVASMLLEKMAVVDNISDDCNLWDEWIKSYLVSQDNGMWTSDLRSSLPIIRPQWGNESIEKDAWFKDIDNINMLNLIQGDNSAIDPFIRVDGGWSERFSDKCEYARVSSSMVSIKGSESLLMTLVSHEDSTDYKLPDFNETMELNTLDLKLNGWLERSYDYTDVECYDPYADNIQRMYATVNRTIIEPLNLTNVDTDNITYKNSIGDTIIQGLNWSDYRYNDNVDNNQSGCCLEIRKEALKELCKLYKINFIFKVNLGRSLKDHYEYSKSEFPPSRCQVFLFTENGDFKSLDNNATNVSMDIGKTIIAKMGIGYSSELEIKWLIFHIIYLYILKCDKMVIDMYLNEYDRVATEKRKHKRTQWEIPTSATILKYIEELFLTYSS